MLAVTVRFRVKSEYKQRFLDRVQRQAKDTLANETDCRQFDVCYSQENPGQVFLYEIYTDDSAFEAHLRTVHFQGFNATTADWVEEKAVERWIRP